MPCCSITIVSKIDAQSHSTSTVTIWFFNTRIYLYFGNMYHPLEQCVSSTYHPQTNSRDKRFNQRWCRSCQPDQILDSWTAPDRGRPNMNFFWESTHWCAYQCNLLSQQLLSLNGLQSSCQLLHKGFRYTTLGAFTGQKKHPSSYHIPTRLNCLTERIQVLLILLCKHGRPPEKMP